MSTKIATLYAEIGADTTKLQAGLTRTKTGLKDVAATAAGTGSKFSRSVSGMGHSVNDLVRGITGMDLAAAAGVGGLILMANEARKAIDAASDLSETVNKAKVVFGDASEDILAFGEDAASAMGMSKQAALEATGTFGNLFVSMGIGVDKSAEMSTGLVQLASDLASFNNIDPSVALEKLRAGIVGETEPLRALGVNLNEAAVQARAMEMGLAGSTAELTAADKATARYSLILEQTQTAQGDFARTSDGLANQQRILKAELDDISAVVGQKLLPAYTGVVGALVDFVGWLMESEKATNLQADALLAGYGVVEGLAGGYGSLAARQYEAMVAAIGLTEAEQNQRDAISRNWKEIRKATSELEDMADATELAKQAASDLAVIVAGQFGKEIKSFEEKQGDLNDKIKETREELAKLGAAEFIPPENAQRIEALTNSLRGVTTEMYNIAQAGGVDWKDLVNTKDLESLGLSQDAIDRIRDLRGEAWQLEGSIRTLGGVPYMTKEQQEDIDKMRGNLQEYQTELDETAKAHEEAMKRMAFNMIQEQAAQDGMTTQEVENLTTLAQAWGLYDDKTAEVVRAVNQNIGTLDTEKPEEFYTILAEILDLPTTHEFYYRANVEGLSDLERLLVLQGQLGGAAATAGQGAEMETSGIAVQERNYNRDLNGNGVIGAKYGANFTVPAGYPNDTFPMMVTSGEHVEVTPAGQTSGSTINVTMVVNDITDWDQALYRIEDARRRLGR